VVLSVRGGWGECRAGFAPAVDDLAWLALFDWVETVELDDGRRLVVQYRWEDDPAVDWDGPDAHSGPNHMSLNEGRPWRSAP
jgi:hypothetical protein